MKNSTKIILISLFLLMGISTNGQTANEIKIAKASIKSLMGINSKYVKCYNDKDKKIIVVQSINNKSTQYGIYFSKNQIMWRIEKDANRNSPGRWRNNSLDEKVIFKTIKNDVVIDIIYSDGSRDRKTYKLSKL